jgi:hypothetical protein
VSIPPLIPYDWFPAGNYPRQAGCSPVLVSVYIDEVFVPKLTLDPADQSARISNSFIAISTNSEQRQIGR